MMTNLLNGAHVANKLFSTIARLRLLLVMFLTLTASTAWGESIEINTTNSTVNGSYRDYEFDVNSITFGCTQWMKNNNIQAKKSTTNSLYNVDAIPGTITSIVVKQTGTARAIKIYGGTASKPTTQITSPTTALEMTFDFTGKNYTYFSLTTPSNACYFDKITINYTPSGGGTTPDPEPATTYTIKWHTAVGTTTDDVLNEGAAITKPATDPTMTGYTFIGWTEDCEVATDGAGFTALSNFGTADSDKDFYAVFAVAETPDGGGATETSVSVKIQNYASANSWANGTKYTLVKIDENITASVSGSSNTGKYYTSGHEWRLYQTESAKLTLSAAEGKTIKTAKITYNVSNTGVLKLNSSNVTSGTTSTINASSVTYNVGNSGSATNGQVKVTAIEVVYTSGTGGGGSTTYSDYITTCTTQTSRCVTPKHRGDSGGTWLVVIEW